MKNKVYCKNCKYYSNFSLACKKFGETKDYATHQGYYHPSDFNLYNDCKYYQLLDKRKWWKLYAK